MASVRYEEDQYEEDSTGRVVIITDGESDKEWFVTVRDINVEDDFMNNLDGGRGEELEISKLDESTDVECARCGSNIEGVKGIKVVCHTENSFMVFCHNEETDENTCYEIFSESAKEAIEDIEGEIVSRQI